MIVEHAIKKSLPSFIGSLKDWFSFRLEISLFGVKVFEFTWPPQNDSFVQHSNSKTHVIETE